MRIPQAVKDCVVYLYDHGNPVGTGFLVGVPTAAGPNRSFCYVVTARHVVRDRTAISVRINSLSGDAVTTKAVPDAWWEATDPKVDVALALLLVDPALISPTMVGVHQIADFDFLVSRAVGTGDEVLTVGLLPSLPGENRNLPIARFGHIARLNQELVPTRGPGGVVHQLDAIMTELTAWPGQSGSPVFVVFPVDRFMGDVQPFDRSDPRAGWALLGLLSGHLAIPQSIHLADQPAGEDDRDESRFIRANSGIASVTLASHILNLLSREDVMADRTERLSNEKASDVLAVSDIKG